MCIGCMCVRDVDTAKANESVAMIAKRMHQRAVGTLIVVNEACQPIGIVTDRDLVTRVVAKSLDPIETLVRDVMTMAPKTVPEDCSSESALLIMRTGRFRRLPVVDQDNQLIGLVTLDDMLMLLAEELSQVGRLLKRETPQAVVEDQDGCNISRFQNESRMGVGD